MNEEWLTSSTLQIIIENIIVNNIGVLLVLVLTKK